MKLSIITNILLLTYLAEPISIPLSRKLVKRSENGGISLTDDAEELWYGTISLGTPAKKFTVDFDTGTADLFLPGPSCGSSCSGHTIYNPSISSSSTDLGKSFTIQHDNESVSGGQYTDTITIGNLIVKSQTLGVASQYSSDFSANQFPADGVLGLAFPEISVFNASPFMQTLIAQNECTESIFAFKLSSSGSELSICSVNNNFYTGDITYTPVTQIGYWQVKLNSINVNDQTVVTNLDAIIDTGSTLVILNSKDATNFYTKIQDAKDLGDGTWSVPCNSNPNISLTFGGISFPISPGIFVLDKGNGNCIGGIGYDDSKNFAIIGVVFLRNVYTIFDIGNTRVGFANLL